MVGLVTTSVWIDLVAKQTDIAMLPLVVVLLHGVTYFSSRSSVIHSNAEWPGRLYSCGWQFIRELFRCLCFDLVEG